MKKKVWRSQSLVVQANAAPSDDEQFAEEKRILLGALAKLDQAMLDASAAEAKA